MDHPRPPPRHHAGRGGLHASIPGGGGSDPDLKDRDSKAKSKGLKGGVEKMKRYLANLSFVEMSVVKATSAADGPPKRKHVARLVEESWRDPQLAPVEAMNALGRCPMLNSPLVSLKVLATAHELMQKGSPGALPASFEWRDHFAMLDAHWTAAVADGGARAAGHGLGRACAGLVVVYSRALLEKARFHDQRRGFENNYSFPGAADGREASGRDAAEKKCASTESLDAMLALGRALRETLDVVSAALPRNPPLATLQWHRLVAHVGVLVAVEAHLLHGSTVYVAATVAAASPGGLDAERARWLSRDHDALRGAFAEARARPAMKTAFIEEGAGGSFSFLELPESVPDFASGGGAEAMASVVASSFGAPSSHQRPSAPRVEDAVASPFDDANSDDELAAATEERSALAEKAETPTIDLPPLIDFDAEEDAWDPPRAAAAPPPPPRPPLFGGYAQTPAQGSGAAPAGANRSGFSSASAGGGAAGGGGYGSPSVAASRPAQKASANHHSRSPSLSREPSVPAGTLDIDASLAAFELTAARPAEGEERRVDGAAPLMFADLAPAGVSSVRVAPAPRSMLAQRGGNGNGTGANGTGGFPSFATSQRVAYGAAAPAQPRPAGLTRGGSGGAPAAPQYSPGHFTPNAPGAFVPAQFPPNANASASVSQQQRQPQQAQRTWMPADQTPRRQSPSPPPPGLGSPPPQDWAKFDDDSAAGTTGPSRRAAAPFVAPAPAQPAQAAAPMNAIVPMPAAQRDAAGGRVGSPNASNPIPPAAPAFDEIPIGAIIFGKRVGTGAFGEVLKATYQGTDVAVKRLRLDPSQPQAAEDFRRELRVLCGLRHRHVVQFLGACTTGPDLCLVMDFCGFGSLYGVLHNRRQNITAAHVLRWMADTCRGMMYLHSRSIIHRDIKSGNLLLDDSGVIKVADFGLARAHGPTSNLLTLVGTYPYMAPELLDSQPYNSSVDVYSFGVVMWECLTRDEPFRGCSPMQIVATLMRGERPKLPERPALPQSYVRVLTECWATQPERRPTFGQALDRLLAITQAMRAAEGESR